MMCSFEEQKKFMMLAYEKAKEGMTSSKGGPFGAVVVKNGEVIAVECNNVLKNNDPTAHAEISAIRQACKVLNTHDLSGCEIYATGEPCPMCLSAIIWAGIDICYYANTVEQAEKIGFRDKLIYEHINGKKQALTVKRLKTDKELCDIYDEYAKLKGIIY